MIQPLPGLPTQPPEPFVTRKELAAILGVSVGTVDNMRRAGMPSVRWGPRARRFKPAEAIAWAQAHQGMDRPGPPTESTVGQEQPLAALPHGEMMTKQDEKEQPQRGRAERIRALKEQHPETTWEEIAGFVGVTPRAAQAWAEDGQIRARNAKRLAELFDADYDWIYWGRGQDSHVSTELDAKQLDRIEQKLDSIVSALASIRSRI
jgi:transcriptional regulator with XRE-family HTH domain